MPGPHARAYEYSRLDRRHLPARLHARLRLPRRGGWRHRLCLRHPARPAAAAEATVHGPATQFWVTHDRGQHVDPPRRSAPHSASTSAASPWTASTPTSSPSGAAHTAPQRWQPMRQTHPSTSSGSDAGSHRMTAAPAGSSLLDSATFETTLLEHTTLGGHHLCDHLLWGSDSGAPLSPVTIRLATGSPLDWYATSPAGQRYSPGLIALPDGRDHRRLQTIRRPPSQRDKRKRVSGRAATTAAHTGPKLSGPATGPYDSYAYVVQQPGGR